jgi:hypothetical protein
MRNEDGGEKATRASLLARVRDWGDDEGWREFHALYGPLIRNVARQSGLPESEADDVAQETLLAVAKKLPGFEYDPARPAGSRVTRVEVPPPGPTVVKRSPGRVFIPWDNEGPTASVSR